jgi:hypothetical protein
MSNKIYGRALNFGILPQQQPVGKKENGFEFNLFPKRLTNEALLFLYLRNSFFAAALNGFSTEQ